MNEPESPRRALSGRTLSLLATIVVVYALGLYVTAGTAVVRMTSSEHIVCDEPARRFPTPGRMGWPHGLHPQDSTGRLLRIVHNRFPYSVDQHPRYLRDEFPITALGLHSDDPGWTRVPRVDGHPLWVKSTLVFGDKLLIWGKYQASPDVKSEDVQLVLDAEGRGRLVRGRQRLAPRAIEASTGSMVSIEKRKTIYGGQPKEEERPPQALVFEPLDESGIPQREGSHRHAIRKLQNLLTDDEGHVFLVRWLAGPMSITRSQYGYRWLEKYSIRERRILWSTQIDDVPVLEHHPRHSRLVLGESGIRFEEDHPIPLDEARRTSRAMWRARIYDRTSGASLREEILPPPNLDPDARAELEIGGRRYALHERGWRGKCLEIAPLASP